MILFSNMQDRLKSKAVLTIKWKRKLEQILLDLLYNVREDCILLGKRNLLGKGNIYIDKKLLLDILYIGTKRLFSRRLLVSPEFLVSPEYFQLVQNFPVRPELFQRLQYCFHLSTISLLVQFRQRVQLANYGVRLVSLMQLD